MAKANANKVVHTVACTFGRDDVRTIKFTATPRKVRITCKGMPPMRVQPRRAGAHDEGNYEASIKLPSGVIEFVTARTPQAAYRKGVRRLWK